MKFIRPEILFKYEETLPDIFELYKVLHDKPSYFDLKEMNNLKVALKIHGIWDKIDGLSLMPPLLGNRHDALINWKNPC